MALEERDSHTGYLTTGHEWNGIKELNTPIPRVVKICLSLAFLIAVGCWILMPAWPTGVSYTRGLLGLDQRASVAEEIRRAHLERSAWTAKIETQEFAAIQADPVLMGIVRETGRTLFGDNCAACHGMSGRGGPGYPNLVTPGWLWGGEPETIAETLRIGINSTHPNTRVAMMPAFGRDKLLTRQEISDVVAFIRSLSFAPDATSASQASLAAGRTLYAANCAACHGEQAKGNTDTGAPDLSDRSWIYGGDVESIWATLVNGRQGHMPAWEGRLTGLERRILALYVLELGKSGK